MIISKTPLRISLVGGGTDMRSFYSQHPGAVVSFAINKFIYVSVNKHFEGNYRVSYSKSEYVESIDRIQHNLVRKILQSYGDERYWKGIEITSVADIPGQGTGLGSSSSFIVGLSMALYKFTRMHKDRYADNFLRHKIAEFAWSIEDEEKSPVGVQDHLAAMYGNFNLLEFMPNEFRIKPLVFDWSYLEKNMLLLYTGITRSASPILAEQQDHFKTKEGLKEGMYLSSLAQHLAIDLLGQCSPKRVGEYLVENWKVKKSLAKGISNPVIDNFYNQGMACGAWGGKLLGAGGGGFMLFIADPEIHKDIIEETGLRHVPFSIEPKGSEIIYAD